MICICSHGEDEHQEYGGPCEAKDGDETCWCVMFEEQEEEG